MSAVSFTLRPYALADEDAAVELWRRTWQQTYPDIDFAARLDWWRARWRNEVLPKATVTLAETGGALIGFVTVEGATGNLDHIVVAPEAWGGGIAQALLAVAQRQAPGELSLRVNTDNARAIRFYEKHGFTVVGGDVNQLSGRPVHIMRWRA